MRRVNVQRTVACCPNSPQKERSSSRGNSRLGTSSCRTDSRMYTSRWRRHPAAKTGQHIITQHTAKHKASPWTVSFSVTVDSTVSLCRCPSPSLSLSLPLFPPTHTLCRLHVGAECRTRRQHRQGRSDSNSDSDRGGDGGAAPPHTAPSRRRAAARLCADVRTLGRVHRPH